MPLKAVNLGLTPLGVSAIALPGGGGPRPLVQNYPDYAVSPDPPLSYPVFIEALTPPEGDVTSDIVAGSVMLSPLPPTTWREGWSMATSDMSGMKPRLLPVAPPPVHVVAPIHLGYTLARGPRKRAGMRPKAVALIGCMLLVVWVAASSDTRQHSREHSLPRKQ